jgi:hypothetical protein
VAVPGQDLYVELSGVAHAFRTATLLKLGRIAAVTPTHIEWLQCGQRFTQAASTNTAIPDAVACFPSHSGLVVVTDHGEIIRVPAPAF